MGKVIYVGGGKGGVGKSLLSMATIDWLRRRGQQVLVVEGDVANPDVFKAYEALIPTRTVNFDVVEGWEALGDLAEGAEDQVIVVNSGARQIDGVRKFGYILEGAANNGMIDLTVLWPINRSRDSIFALQDFRKAVPCGKLGVVRNLYFGDQRKFSRWRDSSYAQGLVQGGARVGDMAELSERLIDNIYDLRTPIEVVAAGGNKTDQISISRWRSLTNSMLDEVAG